MREEPLTAKVAMSITVVETFRGLLVLARACTSGQAYKEY